MATATKKPTGKTLQSSTKTASKTPAAPAKAAAPKRAVKTQVTAPAEDSRKPAARAAASPAAHRDTPAATRPGAAGKPAARATSDRPKADTPAAGQAVEQIMQGASPGKPGKKPAAKPAAAVGAPFSETQLLAMHEDDYMNDVQLAFFRDKLLRMREEILENARETGEHLKENEVFADPNDRATVEEENMLEQRVRDRERKLLKKINASLQRIEDGSYGYCLETGEPIGLPRLLARPTAELSIEAQEKHERLERLYAD